MDPARKILDAQFLEMRWRVLSLAADFDRIERAVGGAQALASDPRVNDLRTALRHIAGESAGAGRAAFVQNLLSDQSPPPARNA